MVIDAGTSKIIFTVFPILMMTVIGISLLSSIVQSVRMLGQWNKNNHSPKLTVGASVVSTRREVSRRGNVPMGNSNTHYRATRSAIHYYVTFQVDTGDRMELQLTGSEFGLIAEGDRGRLTFQGTRFVSFEREN